MTVRAPIIGTNTDSAETFRLALSGLYVPSASISARTGTLTVPSLQGTGNFTATIGPFACVINGTSNSLQGSYPVANDIATTITIGAANTQARIDLISLQIQDNAYDSSGFSRGQFVVTAGTPSGSPVAPSAPANAIPLFQVPVGANATSITWASTTYVASYTAAAGGIVPVRDSTDQPAAKNGVQYRHRMDVSAGGTSPLEYSQNGTLWNPVYSAPGAWTSFTPAWTASTNPAIGNGSLAGYYNKTGRVVSVQMNIQMGSTTTFGSGNWNFGLPFTSTSRNWIGTWWALHGTAVTTGVGIVTSSQFQVSIGGGTSNYANASQPFVWGNGDVLAVNLTYESSS